MSSQEAAPPATVVLAPQKSRRARPAPASVVETPEVSPVGDTEIVEHALAFDWSLWGLCALPSQRNRHSVQNIMIYEFNTVEDFWSIYNSLLVPSAITNKSNVIFMRKGVKPEWEDPQNLGGGEWVAEFTAGVGPRKRVDAVWEHTLLAVLGGALGSDDDVLGVWLGVRVNSKKRALIQKISLWNRSSRPEYAGQLGKDWVSLIKEKTGFDIGCEYTAHADAVNAYSDAARSAQQSHGGTSVPPVKYTEGEGRVGR